MIKVKFSYTNVCFNLETIVRSQKVYCAHS